MGKLCGIPHHGLGFIRWGSLLFLERPQMGNSSARAFSDANGISAIELTVSFGGVMCSTILRLDSNASITPLAEQLNGLRGFTLKQIGEMEFS